MICVQCVLHINCKLFNMKHMYRINISFIQTDNENEKIKEIFRVDYFQRLSVVRAENTVFNVSIVTDKQITSETINEIMRDNSFILSIERGDE